MFICSAALAHNALTRALLPAFRALVEFHAVRGLLVLVTTPLRLALASQCFHPQFYVMFRPLTISSAVGSRPYGKGHMMTILCTALQADMVASLSSL